MLTQQPILPPISDDPFPDGEALIVSRWTDNDWERTSPAHMAQLKADIIASVELHQTVAKEVARQCSFSPRSKFAYDRLRLRQGIAKRLKDEYRRREADRQEEAAKTFAANLQSVKPMRAFDVMTLAQKADALGLKRPRQAMPLLCAIKDALDTGAGLDELLEEMDSLVTIHRTQKKGE